MTTAPAPTYTTRESGALWIQPGGPNTKPYYLGCHDLGDIAAPQGGVTLLQCFDGKGGWRTIGSTQAAPEPVTTNIGTYLGKTLDWIESVKCPAPLYVLLRCGGKPDIFANRERALILDTLGITSRGYTGLVNKSEDQPAMATIDIEAAPEIIHAISLTPVRQTIAETADLRAIASCSDDRCAGPCGGQVDAGDSVLATSEALAASPANVSTVWASEDAGGTYTATSANPFAAGEDIGAVICFPLNATTTRWIVARGEADAGNPAEIAYSDDEGVTWTLVNVGSVNGQFVPGPNALFALDYSHIWLSTNDGYIYFSDDGGVTWTAQHSASLTTNDIFAVHFQNELTGYAGAESDVIMRTLDGGGTWSAVTATGSGQHVRSVWVTEDGRVWVGTVNTVGTGGLYYSNDKGATWTARRFPHDRDSAGAVYAVKFANRFVGYLIHDLTGPIGHILITIDGGYSWDRLAAVTNTGYNGLAVVSENLAYVAGNVSGGTGIIVKVS